MKSIIDILSEDGMAAPLATMGMGNPLPPGAPGAPGIAGEPGSEPVCAKCKKKKKKKVAESLLDDEDSIMDKGELAMIDNWMKASSTSKTYKIDPKTKRISAGYLNVAGPVPPYIKFGHVGTFCLTIYDEPAECEINLPESAQNVKITTSQAKKLVINNINTQYLTIDSTCEKIVFPKRYNLNELVVSNCHDLSSIENFNGAKIETLKLSPGFCKSIIKESLKLGPKAELYVFGNHM